MSKPFAVGKDSMGKVLNLGDIAGTGTNISLVFEPGVGMVVIRTIPQAVIQAVKDTARDQRDIFQKGKVLKGSQNHWLPVASVPTPIMNEWKKELGPVKENLPAWKRRFNDSQYRDFRTSDHTI